MQTLGYKFRIPTGPSILDQAIALCFGNKNALLKELVNIAASHAVTHLFLGNKIVNGTDTLVQSLPLLQHYPQSVLFFAYFRLTCNVAGLEIIFDEFMQRLSKEMTSIEASAEL